MQVQATGMYKIFASTKYFWFIFPAYLPSGPSLQIFGIVFCVYILQPDFIAINVWLCTFITIVSQWITLKRECPQKGYNFNPLRHKIWRASHLFSNNNTCNGNPKKKIKKKKKKWLPRHYFYSPWTIFSRPWRPIARNFEPWIISKFYSGHTHN